MSVHWTTYEAIISIRERIVGGIPVVTVGDDRVDAYEVWARANGADPTSARDLAEGLALRELGVEG